MTFNKKTWHLAESEEEIKITDFEFHLWRVFYGFLRWQEGCENVANQTDLTGSELSILHIIRMNERAKTLNELMRLLNRDDTFNVNYSIRKLIKKGLVKKVSSSETNKKTPAYEITKAGIQNINMYIQLRKQVLVDKFFKKKELNLEKITEILASIIAIYDEADRTVLTYTRIPEKENKKTK